MAKQRMKSYADLNQHVKHREFPTNTPVLHAWDRKSKFQPLFDPHPYRVTTTKGTMITATRMDHSLTRNSRKFKTISEKCYASAMKLMENKSAIPKAPIKFIVYPREELEPYIAETSTQTATQAQINTPSPNQAQEQVPCSSQLSKSNACQIQTTVTANTRPQRAAVVDYTNMFRVNKKHKRAASK